MLKLSAFFIFLLIPNLVFADCIQPTPAEWDAIKSRAFFNKLSIVSEVCNTTTPGSTDRFRAQDRRIHVDLFPDYRDEVVRIENGYYNRIDHSPETSREAGYNAEASGDPANNLDWDYQQGVNAIALRQQAQAAVNNPGTASAYCEIASDAVTALSAMQELDTIKTFAITHDYANENNYTACNPAFAISTSPPAAIPLAPSPTPTEQPIAEHSHTTEVIANDDDSAEVPPEVASPRVGPRSLAPPTPIPHPPAVLPPAAQIPPINNNQQRVCAANRVLCRPGLRQDVQIPGTDRMNSCVPPGSPPPCTPN